jgi:hypothetical protein
MWNGEGGRLVRPIERPQSSTKKMYRSPSRQMPVFEPSLAAWSRSLASHSDTSIVRIFNPSSCGVPTNGLSSQAKRPHS